MNVLAAPFLYTMPSEVEAFFCFSKFIEESCPLYVQPTLEGVHRGLKVRAISYLSCIAHEHLSSFSIGAFNSWILSCLHICDRKTSLQRYMPSLVRGPSLCIITAQINTNFRTAVLTLCACTPPLDQVLQLWDFLLAFGVHLNVLCVIAQLLLMRDEVMASARYGKRFISRIL